MNYFNILFISSITLVNSTYSQFVHFDSTKVNIVTDLDVVSITIPFSIKDGYHIQSDKVISDNLIATSVVFNQNDLLQLLSYRFKDIEYEKLELDGNSIDVISKELKVQVLFKKIGDQNIPCKLEGQLYYQTCDSRKCYFPRELNFEIMLE